MESKRKHKTAEEKANRILDDIENGRDADDDEDEGGGKRDSIADKMVEDLQLECDFFHDEEGAGYAVIDRNRRQEIHRIRSKEFRNFVSHRAWDRMGKALSKTAKENILETLDAIAKFGNKERKMHLRTAWYKNALWYDLGDWRAAKITSEGWRIVRRPPILFKRYHPGVQCVPQEGGDLEDVLRFLNIDRDERYEQYKLLLLTYLPVALVPNIPRPIFILHGLQGSAKTTASKVVKSLIDPSDLQIMAMPQKQQEFTQVASHYYGLFFDNLSRLDDEQSDALCRASTGEGLVKRQLYTDDDDIVYRYRRIVGLNGINIIATKPDLLDRSLIFELRRISETERMDEETFWQNFELAKPKILGAMFAAMSKALAIKEQNDVKLAKTPRMADYALWASRIAIALGYGADKFLEAYEGNIEVQNEEAVENSAVAQTIMEFAKNLKEPISLSGEMMYVRLKACADNLGFERDKDFPASPRWLWKRIKVVQPNLLAMGFDVRYHSKKRPRQIEIRIVKKSEN